MNKETFGKYGKAITDKRDELTDYVKSQIGSIEYPPQPSGATSPGRQEGNGGNGKTAGMAALLLGVAGICCGVSCKSGTLAAVGGVVAAGGLYAFARSKKLRPAGNSVTPDFTALTNTVFTVLERTHKKTLQEWDDYLGKLKDELKNEIATSDLDNETKNKMTEIALGRSLIQASLPEGLAELRAAERQQSVEAYRSVCGSLAGKYAKAISRACAEQLKRYGEMEACL